MAKRKIINNKGGNSPEARRARMLGKQFGLGHTHQVSESHKQRMREIMTLRSKEGRINSPEKRKQQSEMMRGNQINKGRIFGKETREKMRASRIHFIRNGGIITKDTSIERAIESELIKRGIKYQKQAILGDRAIVDFYIPEQNLIVECDGDYWHNLPRVKERDKIRDEFLRETGYNIVRLKEKDIKYSASQCLDNLGSSLCLRR